MQHKHEHSNIGIAFFLNFIFTIIEFVGAFFTNSVAIYSNALHDLGDTISLALGYTFERISRRKKGKKFTYGYRRFSLLAAFINGVILTVGSFFILWEAVPRLIHPEAVHVNGMIGLAVLGIFVNGIAVLRVRYGQTMNAKMIMWHLVEDVLSWTAILVVAVILFFYPIAWLDSALSIMITAYILTNVFKHLRDTVVIFLQGKPSFMNIDEIEKEMLKIKDVKNIHDMHFWSLDGEHHVLTAHIVLPKKATAKRQLEAKCCIKKLMSKHPNIHLTLEIETEDESCEIHKTC